MSSPWQYQVRFDVPDAAIAETIRQEAADPRLAALFELLAAHRGAPKCQFDAFAGYVSEAERDGVEDYPLYAWTKATIEDPAKKEKYLKSFTIYVDDQQVYDKEIADALESGLRPLAAAGLISRVKKYDTNPANNPQPPRPAPQQA